MKMICVHKPVIKPVRIFDNLAMLHSGNKSTDVDIKDEFNSILKS